MLKQAAAWKPLTKFALLTLVIAVLISLSFIWDRFAGAATPLSSIQSFDEVQIHWTMNPSPAKALQNNTFTLTIEQLNGEPLIGAAASIRLDMISMDCADVIFQLIETAPGVYEGEGLPLMAGMWKAYLTLTTNEEAYSLSEIIKVTH